MKCGIVTLPSFVLLFTAIFSAPIAADLIYLGMAEVSCPGLSDTIASLAEELKSLALKKVNVVNSRHLRMVSQSQRTSQCSHYGSTLHGGVPLFIVRVMSYAVI